MGKRNKILNGLFGLMLAVAVVAPFGTMSVNANNHADIPYHFYNGTINATGYATKTDDSYVYIKHGGPYGVQVAVQVYGYSGNYTGMNGTGGYVSVPVGVGRFVTNYVVESFRDSYNKGQYKNIRLQLKSSSAGEKHGVWSPDSI